MRHAVQSVLPVPCSAVSVEMGFKHLKLVDILDGKGSKSPGTQCVSLRTEQLTEKCEFSK